MSEVQMKCPACEKDLRVKSEDNGKVVECPHCRGSIEVVIGEKSLPADAVRSPEPQGAQPEPADPATGVPLPAAAFLDRLRSNSSYETLRTVLRIFYVLAQVAAMGGAALAVLGCLGVAASGEPGAIVAIPFAVAAAAAAYFLLKAAYEWVQLTVDVGDAVLEMARKT